MQLGRFKNRTPARFEYIYCTLFPLCDSNYDMYPFLKDASFCPCFCFVHTIAQFFRILRFSHIHCQIFRIRTHGWRNWRTTALTSTIGSEKFQKFIQDDSIGKPRVSPLRFLDSRSCDECRTIIIYFFVTFLTLSLKLMQWYVTPVIRGSLWQ